MAVLVGIYFPAAQKENSTRILKINGFANFVNANFIAIIVIISSENDRRKCITSFNAPNLNKKSSGKIVKYVKLH